MRLHDDFARERLDNQKLHTVQARHLQLWLVLCALNCHLIFTEAEIAACAIDEVITDRLTHVRFDFNEIFAVRTQVERIYAADGIRVDMRCGAGTLRSKQWFEVRAVLDTELECEPLSEEQTADIDDGNAIIIVDGNKPAELAGYPGNGDSTVESVRRHAGTRRREHLRTRLAVGLVRVVAIHSIRRGRGPCRYGGNRRRCPAISVELAHDAEAIQLRRLHVCGPAAGGVRNCVNRYAGPLIDPDTERRKNHMVVRQRFPVVG